MMIVYTDTHTHRQGHAHTAVAKSIFPKPCTFSHECGRICCHFSTLSLPSPPLSLSLSVSLTALGIFNRAATLKYIEFITQPAGYHLIKSKSVYDPEILKAFINF